MIIANLPPNYDIHNIPTDRDLDRHYFAADDLLPA
jgi:hypothetical protein